MQNWAPGKSYTFAAGGQSVWPAESRTTSTLSHPQQDSLSSVQAAGILSPNQSWPTCPSICACQQGQRFGTKKDHTFIQKLLTLRGIPSLPSVSYNYAFICIWYSFNRYWLSTYHMLGTVLGAGDTAVMKVKQSSWILIVQTCYVTWYMTRSTILLMLPLVVYFSHLNFMKARRHPHSFI